MFPLNRRNASLVAVLGLLSLALLVSGCSAPRVAAAPPADGAATRTITVLGSGSISTAPDLALVSLGVETFAAEVTAAIEDNNTAMKAVIDRLRELGLAEKDIQTSNFSVNSERSGYESRPSQYRVSNMVQVKVRDLSQVSEILAESIEAGANQIWGVTFTVEDQTALEDEARIKAVEDARRRGEALAELSDLDLGQVLEIGESGTVTPLSVKVGMGGRGAAAADLAAPISPGEVQVTYQVQVTFAAQ